MTEPDYKSLWEQMCERFDELDKKLVQREWIGLRWSDIPDQWCGNVAFIEGGRWAEKTLKEKNT